MSSGGHIANLLTVATRSLRSSADQKSALRVIEEIIVNLIGSEELAIFEVEPPRLKLLWSFGVEREKYSGLTFDASGRIGWTAQTGQTFVAEGGAQPVSACVPLKLDKRTAFVIAVFRLLPQKREIETHDRELFNLLSEEAAKVLYGR
jgi:hypothetical protein